MEVRIPISAEGARIDAVIAQLVPDYSRARVQSMLREGRILVDGATVRPATRVLGDETVRIDMVPALDDPDDPLRWQPEVLPIDITHADHDVIVVNKPAGLVVHPGAGNRSGTLVNGLLAQFPDLRSLPRAGLVHRLDKDTTGLLAVARSERAHRQLVAALSAREVTRQYLAIAAGEPSAGTTVNAPVGRHPTQRTRMAVTRGGKEAVTHFDVEERLAGATLLRARLETGRTHQIRVHAAHWGFPLLGDPLYGPRSVAAPALQFERQALHAAWLAFVHPATGVKVEFRAPLPTDLEQLLGHLRAG
ncbi:MAG: RluA family pseudouridine synthase [Pseudomonadota bacterium]